MTGEYNFVYRPDSVIPPALRLSLLPLDYTTVRFHFGPGHSCWKGAVFLIRLPVLTVAFAAMWTASQTRTVAISGGVSFTAVPQSLASVELLITGVGTAEYFKRTTT